MDLDVGCGHKPHGDVNVDLYPDITFHRINDRPLITRRIKNLVRADAQYLPFQNESFETVFSQATLDHIPNPVKMIREMLRVAKKKVVIVSGHRYGSMRKHKPHLHFFNVRWFMNVAEKLGYYYNIKIVKWRYLPHPFFPLFQLPREIEVTLFKGASK